MIKPSRLIVKKRSHDENEICLFISKDNVVVQFFRQQKTLEKWKHFEKTQL